MKIYLRGHFTLIYRDIVLYCCFLTKTQNFRKNRNIKGALSGQRQFLSNFSRIEIQELRVQIHELQV